MRNYLQKDPSADVRKWAVEALAYLTIDAEVKEDLANDDMQMKIICDMPTEDPSTAYSLSCIFMNMTNSYDKPDVEEEMVISCDLHFCTYTQTHTHTHTQ